MRTTGWVVVIVIIIIIAGGAWWYYSLAGQAQNSQTQPVAATVSTIQTSTSTSQGDGTPVSQNLILGLNNDATVGNYLSGYNGMTVYTYSPDTQTPGQSACTGQCAANWPPYTVTSASDIHVSAATTGTVATITRADGTLQVTYNGAPLYFYTGDKNPGDVNGQGVGGVWYVAQP